MADDRAYRVLVTYEAEKELFTARVPELDLAVTGPSRAEALTEAEQAIEQRFAAAAAEGLTMPEPIDVAPAAATLSLDLGADLYRDLAMHARASGLSADAYAAQLLARAIGALDGGRGPRRRFDRPQPGAEPRGAEPRAEGQEPGDAQPRPREDRPERGNERPERGNERSGNDRGANDRGGDRGGRPGGGDRGGRPGGGDRGGRPGGDRGGRPGGAGGNDRRSREGYRPELDDKANFLEYLRGLEKGGGGGRGRR
jgi:predicted RNase H-like HicB family nuclease